MIRSMGGLILLVISSAWALPPNPFQPHISPCDSLAAHHEFAAIAGVFFAAHLSPTVADKGTAMWGAYLPCIHVESAAGLISIPITAANP